MVQAETGKATAADEGTEATRRSKAESMIDSARGASRSIQYCAFR